MLHARPAPARIAARPVPARVRAAAATKEHRPATPGCRIHVVPQRDGSWDVELDGGGTYASFADAAAAETAAKRYVRSRGAGEVVVHLRDGDLFPNSSV